MVFNALDQIFPDSMEQCYLMTALFNNEIKSHIYRKTNFDVFATNAPQK